MHVTLTAVTAVYTGEGMGFLGDIFGCACQVSGWKIETERKHRKLKLNINLNKGASSFQIV